MRSRETGKSDSPVRASALAGEQLAQLTERHVLVWGQQQPEQLHESIAISQHAGRLTAASGLSGRPERRIVRREPLGLRLPFNSGLKLNCEKRCELVQRQVGKLLAIL